MKNMILLFLSLFVTGNLISQVDLLEGYQKKLKGEDLEYHSPHANVNQSLLVRSEDENAYIEWVTQAVPAGYKDDTATFIFMAGIDVNREDKHIFYFYVNDNHLFTLANPDDTLQNFVIWSASGGIELRFEKLLVDKYGDLMGYFYLKLPVKYLEPGQPLRFKIAGETAGSRSWFMVFEKGIKEEFYIIEEQALIRGEDGQNYQQLRLDIVHLGKPSRYEVKVEGVDQYVNVNKGYNITRFKIPEVERERITGIFIKNLGTGEVKVRNTWIRPVREMVVHLIHHSHVDIGYTDPQEVVLEKQWNNLETAIRVAAATQNYPEDAQFRWNTEVMWALSEYMNKAATAEREKVLEAIRNGWLELDALYGNELLGLCNEEEMVRLTEAARRISAEAGVPLRSAMISDIPGWSWGIVPVLAKSGVRYFSLGTNDSHRIGHIKAQLADRPFYWVSPSGKDSILTWVHGAGYALFHTGLGYENINRDQAETKILAYVQQLIEGDYPYPIVPLRYNIGSDNGPPDENLPDFVRNWNEKYVTPRLVISTVSKAFGIFEKEYGKTLPALRGDITCYWEDGAISSARETAMNQASAERLGQAEALWAILEPQDYPASDFLDAWEMVMLFDEHTWGSWNSVSEPLSEFTLRQWKVKKSFAIQADRLSNELKELALQVGSKEKSDVITVFNTNSWTMTGPITIPMDASSGRQYITDVAGVLVPSQVNTDGDIVLIAKDIPALGWKQYKINPGTMTTMPMRSAATTGRLENDQIEVWLDTESGEILKLIDKVRDFDWVSKDAGETFNQYHYVKGRDPKNVFTAQPVAFEEKERGPVYTSYVMECKGEGSKGIETEIRFYAELDYVELINRIDKTLVYEPEGVHFSFPLAAEKCDLEVSLPWASYLVEKEQIPGSNKNFVTTNRYIDVLLDDKALAIISPDAPIFEVGGITADATVYGWQQQAGPKNNLFSFVMNNYWETNYLAAQEGEVEFHYYLYPHHADDPMAAEIKSREVTRPLVPLLGSLDRESGQLFGLNDNRLLVTSLKPSNDGNALIIALWNRTEEIIEAGFFWSSIQPYALYLSDFNEEPVELVAGKVLMEPEEMRVFRVEL